MRITYHVETKIKTIHNAEADTVMATSLKQTINSKCK